jgi:trehalose 6-phosphate phosphatase
MYDGPLFKPAVTSTHAMKRLLSGDLLELQQFAWSRALVAFDFDGTLAPIVADRDAACMRPRTKRLFAQVCTLYPTVVISGRSRADVARRLGGARVRAVIGNHGLEMGVRARRATELNEARAALQAAAAAMPGLDIEDKLQSLAVHYRKVRGRRAALVALLKALQSVEAPLRIVPGVLVLNVLPAAAPNKGDALLALRARTRTDVALYVGDDVTDEDVFRLDQPGRLLSVRVGRSASSSAAYFLRDQTEIDELLNQLVVFRKTVAR